MRLRYLCCLSIGIWAVRPAEAATYFISVSAGADTNDALDHLGLDTDGSAAATQFTFSNAENSLDCTSGTCTTFDAYTWTAGDRVYIHSGTGMTPGIYEVASKQGSGTASKIVLVNDPGGGASPSNVNLSNGPGKTLQYGFTGVATNDIVEVVAGTYSVATGGMTADEWLWTTDQNTKTITVKGLTRPSGVLTPDAWTIGGENASQSVRVSATLVSGTVNIQDATIVSNQATASLLFVNVVNNAGALNVNLTNVDFTCAQSQKPWSFESAGTTPASRSGCTVTLTDCNVATVDVSAHAVMQRVSSIVFRRCNWTGLGRSMCGFLSEIDRILVDSCTSDSGWDGVRAVALADSRGMGFSFDPAYGEVGSFEMRDCAFVDVADRLVNMANRVRRVRMFDNTCTFKVGPGGTTGVMVQVGYDSGLTAFSPLDLYALGEEQTTATLHASGTASAGTSTTVTLAAALTPLTDENYQYHITLTGGVGATIETRRIVSVSGSAVTVDAAWTGTPTWATVTYIINQTKVGKEGSLLCADNVLTTVGGGYFAGHGFLVGLQTGNANIVNNEIRGADTGIVYKGRGGYVGFNKIYGGAGITLKGGRGVLVHHNSVAAADLAPSGNRSAFPWSKQWNAVGPNYTGEASCIINNIFDGSRVTSSDPPMLDYDSSAQSNGALPNGYNQFVDYNVYIKGPASGYATLDGASMTSLADIQAKWNESESGYVGSRDGNDAHSTVGTSSPFIDPANGDFRLKAGFDPVTSDGQTVGAVSSGSGGSGGQAWIEP